MVERAEELFETTMRITWDATQGGMNYTFDRDGEVVDTDRLFWVLCETFAAAGFLALQTGEWLRVL